jgi:MbtH protein
MGGIFALEMARQLEEAGHDVGCLFLLDPTLPENVASEARASSATDEGPAAAAARARWIDRHRDRLRGLSFGKKLGYLWRRRRAPLHVIHRYSTQRLLIAAGLGFNAAGLDVPLPLRYCVAQHYYDAIRKTYRPNPLKTPAKVQLIAEVVHERQAMLHRLFPAGVDVRFLKAEFLLDVLNEPHLSEWMSELKSELAADVGPSAPEPASKEEMFSRDDQAVETNDSAAPQPFRVVTNHAGQFTVWPADEDSLNGWTAIVFRGDRKSCLSHIQGMWVDQRPPSLR